MNPPEIEIVETTALHCRMMAECMHLDTAETARKMGISPRKALWHSYKRSVICKTAFINGQIAAIWGVSGSCFSDVGSPWLVMAPSVDDYPFRVAFIYRQELKKMQKMFPVLEEYVDASHEKAVEMLKLMGFKLSSVPDIIGDATLLRAVRSA